MRGRADLLDNSLRPHGTTHAIQSDMNGIISRKDWPVELLRSHTVKGVFVGGCIERGVGSSFRAKAHAHCKGGEFVGWLCFRRADRLTNRTIVIHELAHLVTGHGHTDTWRAMVIKLGGSLDATDILKSYHKKTRAKSS